MIHDAIAVGGMGSVHLGRIIGSGGFARTVAIKQLHPHLARDPDVVAMFLDEARIAARVQHPNVVSTLDVVADGAEFFLVMDHVLGASWSSVLRAAQDQKLAIPLDIVSAVLCGTLAGLHAAHEACSENGEPLHIVHRDVSPQNILVGVDGIARVADFGIAKAISRLQSTQGDQLKGKLSYMSPEQIHRRPLDRRADVHAAGVVLWESLIGQRLRDADDPVGIMAAVLEGGAPAPSTLRSDVPPSLDTLIASALAVDPALRPVSAAAMARELSAIVPPAVAVDVARFVTDVVGGQLDQRRRMVAEVERSPSQPTLPSDPSLPSPLRTGDRRALVSADTVISKVEAAPIMSSRSSARQRARRFALIVVAASFLASVAVVIGVFVSRGRQDGASVHSSAERPAEVGRPASDVSPSSSAGVVAVSPRSEPSSQASLVSFAPAASASTGGHASATAGPATKAPAARRLPPPSATGVAASPSATSGCNPNYTIDSTGLKRFKPWCL